MTRGQAAAGDEPGLAGAVGDADGRAVSATVGTAVTAGVGAREADGDGAAAVGDGVAGCWGVQALMTTIPSAVRSAAYITKRPNIRCKPDFLTSYCRDR